MQAPSPNPQENQHTQAIPAEQDSWREELGLEADMDIYAQNQDRSMTAGPSAHQLEGAGERARPEGGGSGARLSLASVASCGARPSSYAKTRLPDVTRVAYLWL